MSQYFPQMAKIQFFSEMLHYLIPTKPIQKFSYLCDKKFHVDQVMHLFKKEDEFQQKDAIILINGEEATLFFYDSSVD